MLGRWSDYAAVPLRVLLGCFFVVLGLQKLAGYFGGAGLAATADSLAAAGMTPGLFWAWLAVLVELLGGAAVVIGLFTRWAALALALESLIVVVGAPHAATFDFRLAAFAAFLALALLGPQRYAVDLTSPKLAAWSDVHGHRNPASKAA